MHITASQMHAAMAAIVEAPDYPLLQSYKQDFYKHDLESLRLNWTAQSRAIWVVTPNGTHLCFVGHHEHQIDHVDAAVHSGYEHIEIYLLRPSGIKRITRGQALDEARKLDFRVKAGGHVTDALGNTVAYMSLGKGGDIRRRTTTVHFDPGLNYTGSPSHVAALRNIALHESIRAVQTLFVSIQRITIGDALLTANGLINVPHQDNGLMYVLFSAAEFENDGKGFFSKRRNWGKLTSASLLPAASAWVGVPTGTEVITLREAHLRIVERQVQEELFV